VGDLSFQGSHKLGNGGMVGLWLAGKGHKDPIRLAGISDIPPAEPSAARIRQNHFKQRGEVGGATAGVIPEPLRLNASSHSFFGHIMDGMLQSSLNELPLQGDGNHGGLGIIKWLISGHNQIPIFSDIELI